MDFWSMWIWLELYSGPFWIALILFFLFIRWKAIRIARRLMSKYAAAAGYQPEMVVRNNWQYVNALKHYIMSACFCAIIMMGLIAFTVYLLYPDGAGYDLMIHASLFVLVVASLLAGKRMLDAARYAYESLDDFARTLHEGSPHLSHT